uniref:NADH-ubiquinone oxidoreductase chain 2 n=1 Tax=Elateroidea sp. 10 KM-2017 TaxID=2219424 RepID=A0A346RGZ3_9COLE|nr:NADH dehydrogenase subunit 2 [Elateroidea sp. 10 KM-2017]
MLFFLVLVLGTMISISSYSWMGMWMGLEMNLLAIIPVMHSPNNAMTTESTIKYFITQAIASSMILFSILLISVNMQIPSMMLNKSTIMMIMNSCLLMKMGAAPFHFWFPEVMEGLSWMNCLLMLTWQKIAPMVIIMYNLYSTTFAEMTIIMSMMISGILGINQVSTRKIMTYSSINHIGWMMAAMMYEKTTWTIYFMIYSAISTSMILYLKWNKISSLNQIQMSQNSKNQKIFFMLSFLNLAGIPPFMGFFPKWIVIQLMIENQQFMMTTLMTLMTLIPVFMYTRPLMSSMMMKTEMKWKTFSNWKSTILSSMNLLTIMGLPTCTMIFSQA